MTDSNLEKKVIYTLGYSKIMDDDTFFIALAATEPEIISK
jgi:hypothetical protein